MTKTLYDPEVEKRGIEKGIQKGLEKGIIEGSMQKEVEIILNMLGQGLDDEMISKLTNVDIDKVRQIRANHMN